eukprot:scaffold14842_cov165-Amphora_coffeaeformis.AAC.1
MNRRKDGVRNLSVASLGLRKLKGPRRGVGWVVEGYGVGPGDVFAGVWDGGGFELHALQVFDDSVGCGAVSVPDGPPAAGCFWEVLVRGWLAEEVAVVGSWCDEEEFVGGVEDGFVEGGGVGFAGDE